MCKINGHSLFTYIAQPHNAKALASSEKRARAVEATKANSQADLEKNHSDGDENAKTATVARVNKSNKNQTLSSLRNPIGVNIGDGTTKLGLNLGG